MPAWGLLLGSVLPRVILGLLVECVPIILVLLSRPSLHGIIRHRLQQQLLRRNQHIQYLAARLPYIWLQDAYAHAAMFVEGDIWVVYSRLEVDLWGFERVLSWEDKE